MKNYVSKIFDYPFALCRKHKLLIVSLIISTIIMIVIAVVSGIKLNKSMFPQNFSNVSYIKFLKGSSGFVSFMFSTLFANAIFITVIWLSCIRPYLIPIGLLFYLYYVYAQTVTIISVMLDFGFFNTIIVIIFLILISFVYFFLYLLLIICSVDCTADIKYCSLSFRLILPLIIMFIISIIFSAILLLSLKNFVIILVYA